MDATTAPHRIPPEMPQYGEANHVFELMQNMLEQLLIHQPKDPIPFMIDHLQRDNDYVPKIVILGPPASGKTTLAMWLGKHLNSNLLSVESLIAKEYSSLAADARRHYQKFQTVPSMLLVRLVQERLREEDCIRRGWILDGIPETREQALLMQTLGAFPRQVLVLSAPDTVLIERNLGKRIDPQTGEIYHATFDWPPEPEIQKRLIAPAGISGGETARRLLAYHRNIARLLPSYPKILKVIAADQPCVDVFYQVCCGQLLKEAVADKSEYGELIRPFFEKETAVPDNITMKVLKRRLDRQDCVERGWVLHGFPRDGGQALLMDSMGYKPNRVFFLNVPFDSILERLTLRRTDPVTGERSHLMYKPPPTMEIQARLLQSPKDSEEQIKLRMDRFYRNSAELEEFYGQAITLNGDQDPYTVFEYIESGIINPLRKKAP
ncbi:adenylate kinase 8 isoform X5 [Physeter macrocephalus]|uniref:Adenylate kinase 8 isoform X5 n=1 Tax=Physeter macrocephalus TaxID=9755 RepID=A0A455BZ20_PHYMC|nr:adenylate kinase 8 isoform X5 [Physeter catodon]|eukprot:XP_028353028.1 adenylate kinase 8 isoform X5 [Physeter catodon]